MRKTLFGILFSILSIVGLTTVSAGTAHADSITTAGYYSSYLDHGGNPANGRVLFEAWIVQLRNSSNVVYGTFGITKVTDVSGGVVAVESRRTALGVYGGPNMGTCQVNDTPYHQDTPGNGLYVQQHSHDVCGHSSWASTVGVYDGIGGGLVVASTIAVRWADGQLGVYSLGSLISFTYRCAGDPDSLQSCGSVNQTTSV